MENFSQHFGPERAPYRAAYLISSFLHKDLSEEEQEELDQWILASESNMQLFEDLTDEKRIDEFLRWYAELDDRKYLEGFKLRVYGQRRGARVRSLLRVATAACVVGLIGWGVYVVWFARPAGRDKPDVIATADIAPGSSRALLKVAGRPAIYLDHDTVLSAELTIKDGVVINSGASEAVVQHEVIIPRKGFYAVQLPDGTKVWLNSESSLSYPSAFTDSVRRVIVTGESYFEVAKDAAHPFIVSVNGVEVRALGTAFNINAYPNEGVLTTTLVEGSVRISNHQQVQLLQPNQQLTIGNDWKVATVDVSPVLGWRRNEFLLRDATIDQVMRQVERWYDAKVVYASVPSQHFNGKLSRSAPLSKLLHLLEKTGQVHFKIEGNTITVSR